jgi:hypothetical protein
VCKSAFGGTGEDWVFWSTGLVKTQNRDKIVNPDEPLRINGTRSAFLTW